MLTVFMASGELNPLYIIVFLIAVTTGAVFEIKRIALLPRTVINICSLTFLIAILSQIRHNYIIEPFMQVILAISAIKMLEKKSARDYMQLLLLSLMMLICYAMINIDKSFILYCFGAGMIWSFIMTLSSWQTKDSHAVISFGNLLRLFSSSIFMFLLMIPLCLLIFVVTPRIRSPFFGVYNSQGANQIGFSDQVRLGDVSEIQRNNRLAFRAEMSRLPFAPYWRGVVLNSFDGRMWRYSQTPMRLRPIYTDEETAKMVRQEIYLEPGIRRYLFALDIPVSVSKVEAQVSGGNSAIIYRGRNDGRRLQYTATSVPSNAIRMESGNFNKQHNLYLPPDFIPELKNEVERITKGLSQSKKISAILQYLSPPAFEYSLSDMSVAPNALEHFIFVNKKGSCEFFASAMGVMLRMAGIPSRLIGGYRGGVYNETGGYYAVFEESAHAWVELWDEENTSWVRYDPTPHAQFSDSGLQTEIYGFWESYLDLLDYHWTKFVLNYNLEIQVEVLSSVKSFISNPKAFELKGSFEHLPLIAGIAALIVIGVYFYWRMINRNKGEVLLHKFILIMKRKGFYKHKSEGLHEFSDRLPEMERIKAMPFIERFEEHYYKEKEFDETTVKILYENLRKIH